MADAVSQKSADLSAPAGSGGFLEPSRILGRLGIRPGMVVADFGCGGGYFAIPAARMVGDGGKVFAVDIQKQAIENVRSKANLEHLLQLETVWADLESPKGSRLPDASVDLAIIANILFQAEKKREVLAEAWRVLRTGGSLVVLEWDDHPFPAGPAMPLRVPKDRAHKLAEEVGFTLEQEIEAGSHHYGLLFKKQ